MPTEDWITKTSNDLGRIRESLVTISRRLHEQTEKLEKAVEGEYASEASDPRVRLLNEALHVSRDADLQLGQIKERLVRITQNSQDPSRRSDTGIYERVTSSGSLLQQNERKTLYEITRVLNSTLEFDSVLRLVMDLVIQFVSAERGCLMLINPDIGGDPEFTIARDKLSQPIARSEFATISQNTIRHVIRTGKPVLTDDAQADDALKAHESILAYNIRSIMCAPLIVRDHCIGAVYVDRRFTTTPFEGRHQDLLLAFCNQAAIAIDNARLFQRVKEDKQYMDNIFGSIVNGVVTTDSAGIITTFNAAASLILSMPPDQIIGQHYTEAFKSLSQVGLIDLLQNAHIQHENGTVVNEMIECSIPGRKGTVSLNCYVSSLRDTQNTHIGMALVIDDQTSVKQAKQEAEKVRRMFERYVHPNVVQQLMQHPHALKLGGETKEISVIFADIRGYTRLSESMPPGEVMHMINDYLDKMCDAIWAEGGTLTAFQGDALMAIFNAPLRQDDHALRAVRAAWYMREAVRDYQSRLPPTELRVSFGFGVNTGLATVGNVGAHNRLQNYTAIGDVINVASRLQSNATDNEIFINASTYRQVSSYVRVDPAFNLGVKNRTVPLTVYRLLGPI